jgi:hypothetical protein
MVRNSNNPCSTSGPGVPLNSHASTSGSSKCHSSILLTRVPVRGRLWMRPLAMRILSASR